MHFINIASMALALAGSTYGAAMSQDHVIFVLPGGEFPTRAGIHPPTSVAVTTESPLAMSLKASFFPPPASVIDFEKVATSSTPTTFDTVVVTTTTVAASTITGDAMGSTTTTSPPITNRAVGVYSTVVVTEVIHNTIMHTVTASTFEDALVARQVGVKTAFATVTATAPALSTLTPFTTLSVTATATATPEQSDAGVLTVLTTVTATAPALHTITPAASIKREESSMFTITETVDAPKESSMFTITETVDAPPAMTARQ
ncbi:uncharacterized protein RCC_05966 [Ramularia collo-cygni]|uniref:Uncharacterized protein n=1 Tax=Ramularia collo-cygni TaxID=112498 RepID=A0A2D3VEE3_9PEZI|nr:uncharacterized protein RCC_05966 [Ramularia collo-cygni]CZT20109.1 uncharacterized protein RCC_05966 [Ramularia collo-cygni]